MANDKVQQENMTIAYNCQKIANNYWDAIHHFAVNTLKNNHLANKISDIQKSTQKIFTPIEVYLKKTNGDDSVYDMQMEYMLVFDMLIHLSPTQLAMEKERLQKLMK